MMMVRIFTGVQQKWREVDAGATFLKNKFLGDKRYANRANLMEET